MKLAFYKAKGNTVDRVIRSWTNSDYSHVELIIDPRSVTPPIKSARTGEMIDPSMFKDLDLYFSASIRDRGVRFKTIVPDLNNWDIIDIMPPITDDQYVKIIEWCNQHVSDRYGFVDVARFVLPTLKTSRSSWFCSEVVLAALQSAGLFPRVKAQDVSPQELYELVVSFNLMHTEFCSRSE